MELLYGRFDTTAPPDASVTELSADILREIVPKIDNDRDRAIVMYPYYCGEPSVDDAAWSALAYVGEKGWKLDKSYWPRIQELAATSDYGDDALECVDPAIFE